MKNKEVWVLSKGFVGLNCQTDGQRIHFIWGEIGWKYEFGLEWVNFLRRFTTILIRGVHNDGAVLCVSSCKHCYVISKENVGDLGARTTYFDKVLVIVVDFSLNTPREPLHAHDKDVRWHWVTLPNSSSGGVKQSVWPLFTRTKIDMEYIQESIILIMLVGIQSWLVFS